MNNNLKLLVVFSLLCMNQALAKDTGAIRIDSKAIDCSQGSSCLTCRGGTFCDAEGSSSFIGCELGMVCDPDDLPLCVDASEVPTENCGCSSINRGFFRDFYDPQRYYECDEGTLTYFQCMNDTFFSESEQRCVPVAACTSQGCFGIVEECNVYFCCSLDPQSGFFTRTFQECQEDNEVYDYANGECIDPTFSCVNRSDGYYRDTRKCDLFHLCNDDVLLNTNCCDVGEYYDDTVQPKTCAVGDNTCGFIGTCYDDYWESSTCSNKCSQNGDVFSSHNKCTKYYYECETIGFGTEPFPNAKECYNGLIFNPVTEKCDNADNVSECP